MTEPPEGPPAHEVPPLSPLDRKEAKLDALRSALIFIVTVLLVANTSLTVFMAVQDHHRIKQNQAIQTFIKTQAIKNHRISEEIKAQGKRITSCTSPGGKCYDRGQKATAAAVGSINTITIVAAACAVNRTGTVDQIEAEIKACIQYRLAVAASASTSD